MKGIVFRLFFILILPCIFSGYAAAAESKLVEKVLPIGKVHSDWEIHTPSVKISPDSTRITYVTRKNKKFVVVENGRLSPEYDGIGKDTPVFSPDSKHMVYIAKKVAD